MLERLLAALHLTDAEAARLRTLARYSRPKVLLDTAGGDPKKTELANRFANLFETLDPDQTDHLMNILRMLEDDSVYCVDILKQIKAVDGALDKIGDLVLRSHLKDHVVTAHERGDVGDIVEELMEVLKYR